MVTKAWKVYGLPGHRQRESFFPSVKYDWSKDGNARILEVFNSDRTGTNEYSIIRISRNTRQECVSEFFGQLWDGTFENCRVGDVEEIDPSSICY